MPSAAAQTLPDALAQAYANNPTLLAARAQLRERFAFPASIRVYEDGSIKDSLNRVEISQELPRRLFSFEQPLTADEGSKPQ